MPEFKAFLKKVRASKLIKMTEALELLNFGIRRAHRLRKRTCYYSLASYWFEIDLTSSSNHGCSKLQFLKLLEEEDAESRNLRKDEVALAKAVDAMVQSIREKQIDGHTRG